MDMIIHVLLFTGEGEIGTGMEAIRNYLKKCSMRRVLVMLFGVVFLGWGIATFRLAALGTDPYNGMNIALADWFHITYPVMQILVNIIFFIIQLVWGRSLLGPGTVVNAFGLAYVVSFFYEVYLRYLPQPDNLALRIVILLAGLVISSLGLSMCQSADLGVAPFDAFPLILTRKIKNSPFFVWRVVSDGSCALICFLAGGVKLGVLGLGTILIAFGFGPVIQFFDHTVSAYLLREK